MARLTGCHTRPQGNGTENLVVSGALKKGGGLVQKKAIPKKKESRMEGASGVRRKVVFPEEVRKNRAISLLWGNGGDHKNGA